MEKMLRIFEAAIDQGASDIFIVPGTQIKFAVQGRTVSFGDAPLRAAFADYGVPLFLSSSRSAARCWRSPGSMALWASSPS